MPAIRMKLSELLPFLRPMCAVSGSSVITVPSNTSIDVTNEKSLLYSYHQYRPQSISLGSRF